MQTFLEIIQWLVPAGGLGSVAIWAVSKTVRSARVVKEVHSTYKVMYEDISETLLKIQAENEKLRKAVSKLERAVSRAATCRYYDVCPISDELQKQQNDGEHARAERKKRDGGQHEHVSGSDGDTGGGVGGECGSDHVAG